MTFKGLEYEKTGKGYVVCGAAGRGKRKLTVPSLLGSVPAIGVRRVALKGNDGVRSVRISPGVRFMEAEGFKDAGYLKRVTFPGGDTGTGPSAFDGCSRLAEVRLPEGLEVLERYVFDDCAALKSVGLPESLERISRDAFSDDCGTERIFYEGTRSGWERIEGHDEIPSRTEIVISGGKEEKRRRTGWKKTD